VCTTTNTPFHHYSGKPHGEITIGKHPKYYQSSIWRNAKMMISHVARRYNDILQRPSHFMVQPHQKTLKTIVKIKRSNTLKKFFKTFPFAQWQVISKHLIPQSSTVCRPCVQQQIHFSIIIAASHMEKSILKNTQNTIRAAYGAPLK
jgi:hypothetical protein